MKLTLKSDLDLARTLNKGNWAILTATMEAHGSGHTPRNVGANECLAEYLDEQDFAYIPLTGFYKGVDQGTSFLVLEIDANDALDLSRRLRQESFLAPEGLVYTTGAINPRVGCFVFGKSAADGPAYSRTENGLAFRMDLRDK